MMEAGAYLQAASIFEELARRAQQLQVPRAPFLFVQAGRAFYLGKEIEKGLDLLRHGLLLLAEAERWGELARVGGRVTTELKKQGAASEAEKLTAWLERVLPRDVSPDKKGGAARVGPRSLLPTHCPQCGGPVDAGTVTWQDAVTAECLYCGSAIRTEN